MKDKSFAVVGLGQFGMTLAKTLSEANYDVLAIDDKEENIQEISELATYAIRADVRDTGAFKALGIQDVDVAIIAISENMEASITATMQAKEMGVPFVIAKANNGLHGRILSKIGADKVIYPEQAMGLRVARNLTTNGFLDVFELSSEFSIAEFRVPEEWIGKSLIELRIREKYRINVIGIKYGETVEVDIKPNEALREGCCLLVIGKNKDINADIF